MGGVSWSEHNKLKQRSNSQQQEINDLNKRNEELNKRFMERQAEIHRQEELRHKQEDELNARRKLAFDDLEKSVNAKQEEEFMRIEQEFINMGAFWCEEEIKNYDFSPLLKKCYSQLIKSEELEKSFSDNIKNLLKELTKQNEISHLNIQIIGKTGVGKSTLVNAILSENLAQVKKGEPCTMETTCYQNEKKYPFIRIYDTRGIEISQNFNIDTLFNNTFKEIKEKCEKNEPDDLIHCLFYCFTGSRFEKNEAEILIKLRKTYEGNKLPIILVLTQSLEDEDDEEGKEEIKGFIEAINHILEDKCEENISDAKKGISLVQVLAKEKKLSKKVIIPPKGLDILMEKCLQKAEYSSGYACSSAIKFSAEKKIKEDFKNIRNEILTERERILEMLFEKKGLEEKIFEEIIEKIFMPFTLNNIRQHVKQETFEIIKEINKKIIEIILEKEEKNFRNFLEEKAKYVAKELIDAQTTVNKKHDTISFGGHLKDLNEFEYKIIELLKLKFRNCSKIYAIHNAAKILSVIITDVFMNCFVEDYLKEIKSDETKTFLHSTTNNCFSKEFKDKIGGLISDLKQYQERTSN